MQPSIHLLSCTCCRRQLDVSQLEVGAEVQCVCNTVLTVGPPKVVNIRGTACGRCGGAIKSDDADCQFCGCALSPVDRQETTLCPVCAIRLPNDSRHCKGCGAELRASAVPPMKKGAKCPRCDGRLRIHLLPDAEVIECADDCGGLWCTRATFERIQRNAKEAVASGRVRPTSQPSQDLLGAPAGSKREYVPCLTCGELMQRHHFKHQGRPSGIVLDVCRDHGVWFDRGELEGALAFIRSQTGRSSGLPSAGPAGTNGPPAMPVIRSRKAQGASDSWASSVGEDLISILEVVLTFSLFD